MQIKTSNNETCFFIGRYIVRSNSEYMPNPMYYYIFQPSNEVLLTIKEAYEAGIEGVDDALTYCSRFELIGDVNHDKVLNIRDVTIIQKHLVNLLVIENDNIYGMVDTSTKIKSISDFNQDGMLNIKDATAIQKHIAGIET